MRKLDSIHAHLEDRKLAVHFILASDTAIPAYERPYSSFNNISRHFLPLCLSFFDIPVIIVLVSRNWAVWVILEPMSIYCKNLKTEA